MDADPPSGAQMMFKKIKIEQTLHLKYKVDVCHEDCAICKNLVWRVFLIVNPIAAMFRVYYNRSNSRQLVLIASKGVH